MELKFWIYLIVGAIYVLARLRKKSGEKPPATPEVPRPQQRMEMPTTHSKKPKPLTFDELLREITEAKSIKEESKPVLKPVYVDDDKLDKEQHTLEELLSGNKKKDAVQERFEKKKQAFSRSSLEETMKLQDTDTTFGKFKGFEVEEELNLLEEYTRDFRDPEGFKKAFVMSEILNRKF